MIVILLNMWDERSVEVADFCAYLSQRFVLGKGGKKEVLVSGERAIIDAVAGGVYWGA